MSEPMIPIMKPLIGQEEVDAATRTLLSGWTTQGPEVAGFEAEFAQAVAAKHACAVSSCTTGLHLALLAVGVQPGDEVVTVSHSFIATANSIRYCGAIPVFVDIEPDTFNINPELLERAIGPKTRALLVVHQMGMPCDLGTILPIARKHKLPVVEDAACAVGSEISIDGKWQRIGQPHGDVAVFSFHPRKLLSTGDGGMLVTADSQMDARFRAWRQHGMTVSDAVRHSAKEVIFESYPVVGYNYRMTDIQAAVGRAQLKRLPEIVEKRRSLAERYHSMLCEIPGVTPPRQPSWARSNFQSYCVRLPVGSDQKRVMQLMLDRNIATRRGVMCSHKEAAYPAGTWTCTPGTARCQCNNDRCARLQVSEESQTQCIILPLYHQMSDGDQDRVCAGLRDALVSQPVTT